MAILPGRSLGFRKSEGSSPTLMSRKCGQRTFWTRLLRRCGTAVDVKNVWFLLLLHSVFCLSWQSWGKFQNVMIHRSNCCLLWWVLVWGASDSYITYTCYTVILDRQLMHPVSFPPCIQSGWMGSRMIWVCGWRHWAILTKTEMAVFPLMSFVTLAESNCSSRAVGYCGWWIARYIMLQRTDAN